jgi:pyridoxine 4-oxidase
VIHDAPIIDPNYLDTAHDCDAFRAALSHARLVGGSDGLAAWRESEAFPGVKVDSPEAEDAFTARAAITHHQPVGTLSIGASEDALVTPYLRFRGIDGLRIVDASVIPSITAGPVHASVPAIAELFAVSHGGGVVTGFSVPKGRRCAVECMTPSR